MSYYISENAVTDHSDMDSFVPDPLETGEQLDARWHVLADHLPKAFEVCEEVKADEHELFSTIKGTDGADYEITPGHYSIVPHSPGQFVLNFIHKITDRHDAVSSDGDDEGKRGHKTEVVFGSVLVLGVAVMRAAKAINQRRKST